MGRTVTFVGKNDQEKRELKKHAAVIHCSNSLSLLQRKITNALLYHAYKELLEKEEHEITIKQLCRFIGYQGHNHAAIKDAFKGLISTILEWNLINDAGQEDWTASSILASVSLKGPVCYYAYSPRMRQLLHSPSMFGKINLVIQAHFRSSYGLALYENCIRYLGLPHTKWIDMETFKKMMGVPEKKYAVFRDFKRRVLDKAIEEVNTYSDLFIEAECVREGRKVVKLRFLLKERNKKVRLGVQTLEPDDEYRHLMRETFKLSEEQIEALIANHPKDYVLEKMQLIMSSTPYKKGKILNLSAYLLSAIKNNYQNEVGIPKKVPKPSLKNLKGEIVAIEKAYFHYRTDLIEKALAKLNHDDYQSMMTDFLQFAKPTIDTTIRLQRHKYNPENILSSPQIKALFRHFALQNKKLIAVMSIDEYVLTLSPQQKAAWQQYHLKKETEMLTEA